VTHDSSMSEGHGCHPSHCRRGVSSFIYALFVRVPWIDLSCVWHDSLICVTWLGAIPPSADVVCLHSNACHSNVCHKLTHTYVWRDSCMCERQGRHPPRDKTHSYVSVCQWKRGGCFGEGGETQKGSGGECCVWSLYLYGVAMNSRLLTIIGLFCRIKSLL